MAYKRVTEEEVRTSTDGVKQGLIKQRSRNGWDVTKGVSAESWPGTPGSEAIVRNRPMSWRRPAPCDLASGGSQPRFR